MSCAVHNHEEKSKLRYLWLLPQELFLSVSDYLIDNGQQKFFQFNDDWRCFMNTSKEYLAELKRQTQYIALNHNYSNQFRDDPIFRQRILSLVSDPSLQISCSFQSLGVVGEHYDATLLCNLNRIDIDCDARSLSLITNVEEVHLSTGGNQYLDDFKCLAQVKKTLAITIWNVDDGDGRYDRSPFYDLSCLSPTLESLSLLNANRVTNYHFFTSLREVELEYCDSIQDVSCFRNARMVRLSACHNVTDVNSLANVMEVILLDCAGVTDVSALGSVEVMNISSCKNLHDLSALTTVHTLTVSEFPENLLIPLNQNTVLYLSPFPSELSSLQFLTGNKLLRELDISCNNNIRDVSMLSTVEVLDIRHCPLIKSLVGLIAVRELHMIGVKETESGFEVFQQLTRLSIGKVIHKNQTIQALEKAPFLSSLSLSYSNLPIESLSQVKDLTLECCGELIEFPATLIHLQSLKLGFCRNLESFPAFLPSLQLLHIGGSDKLSLLKVCGQPSSPAINEVKISRCMRLKEIQIGRRITSLQIQGCRNLEEISGKELVRSLKGQH
jgi:hypothetical protein